MILRMAILVSDCGHGRLAGFEKRSLNWRNIPLAFKTPVLGIGETPAYAGHESIFFDPARIEICQTSRSMGQRRGWLRRVGADWD